jgi:uncharacterized protein (UPF0548 family)
MPPAIANPRWSIGEPDPDTVAAFLSGQGDTADVPFSYDAVGQTRGDSNAALGYTLDHNRQRLGEGEADFAAGCAALQAWQMFPRPWTRISPAGAPIRAGQTLAMQAHAIGVWWLNACRIVYVLDEHDAVPDCRRRFGFAYGTLPAHVEQGEERFSVELREDGSVWYDVLAFSRPRYWPVRLAKALARRLQGRFVRESKAAMLAAVRSRQPGVAAS